jgi:DNA polymerase-3 subunit delta
MVQYRAFRQQLAREGCRPAYLLIGEEEYLKGKACLEIAKAFLDQSYSPDAVRTIYASDVDGPGIVEQCLNLGLFQQRQVLVAKEADALTAKGRKAVLGYLERPSPDTCLVLSSFKLDEKSPLVRDSAESATAVRCETPSEEELTTWILSSARERGMAMDREAAEALISISGTSLGLLDRELEKISQYLGEGQGRKADKAAVKALAGLSAQASPDDLSRAVGGKDLPGAMTLLQQLFDGGEDPVRLTAGLFYQMEHLWKVRLAGESRRTQGTIDRRTYWGLKTPATAAMARKRGDRQYLEAMTALFEAEHRMKSGGGDSRTLAAQAVHRLTTK